MTRFYMNLGSLGHTDFRPSIQQADETIEAWIADPNLLIQPTTDCFGNGVIPLDETLATILDYPDEEALKLKACSIIKCISTVIKRQMSEELTVPITPQLRKMTKSTPVNNIWGERVMGMTDKKVKDAPTSKIKTISAKTVS